MQRIANSPHTLRALTNPITGAPPRIDDPVWNPKRVQGISTIAGTVGAPLSVGAFHKLLPWLGKAHLETIFAPSKDGLSMMTAIDGLSGASGYAAKKLIEGQSEISRAQRLRDAEDILSGKNVRPAIWKNPFSGK